MYTADWNSIKLSAAYTFTWMESAATSGFFEPGFCDIDNRCLGRRVTGCFHDVNTLSNANLHQIGGSILHKPSGLGIFGQYTHESTGGGDEFFGSADDFRRSDFDSGRASAFLRISNPETNTWYVKPFWRKNWSPLGATTLYGEYGQYNDQFQAGAGGLCGTFDGSFGTNIDPSATRSASNQWQLHGHACWTSLSRAQKCSAGALAWCRRSTQRPCMSTRGGSTRTSIST